MSTQADSYGTQSPGSTTANGAEASQSAAHLMELTARATEQWRADAKDEAAALLAEAREQCAGLLRAAREEADQLVATARRTATKTTDEARAEAYQVREQTAAVRQAHERDVARLDQIATDHREHLRRHLTGLLDQVNAEPDQPAR